METPRNDPSRSSPKHRALAEAQEKLWFCGEPVKETPKNLNKPLDLSNWLSEHKSARRRALLRMACWSIFGMLVSAGLIALWLIAITSYK